MNPRVKEATPGQNYTVHLIFDNGEEGVFDVKPYLDKGVFKELKNLNFFNSVKPFMGTIQWKNGQDFCPDTLYIESKRLTKRCTRPLFSCAPKRQVSLVVIRRSNELRSS